MINLRLCENSEKNTRFYVINPISMFSLNYNVLGAVFALIDALTFFIGLDVFLGGRYNGKTLISNQFF